MVNRANSYDDEKKASYEGSRAGPDVENFTQTINRDKGEDEVPWYKQRKLSAAKQDPFGDEEGSDIKYKTMTWWQAYMVMTAETVSLGILSLPSVLASIGMVPGIILITSLGLLATYTGYTIWQFKMAYPHVHNMADVGEVMLGRWGKEIGGGAQTIFLIFSMASHILTWTIAFNAMTDHGTCTIVFAVVGLLVFWILTLPRTLKKVAYLSIVSFISILGAVMITMIGLGVAPKSLEVAATTAVPFASAFLSVSNIIFAYAGHVAFFSFISELKDPREFPKALYCLQATDTSLYLVVAIVVYRYAGEDVASPALGSASRIVMKVAYGIALPTILIAGVIYGHVAAKYIYVRMFRGTRHMAKKTVLSVGSWALITLVLWIIAFIIAESIPNFNNLLALISALFASWFTYGLSGVFWLYINKGQWFSSTRKSCLAVLNWLIVALGFAIMGMGLYASGKAIHESPSGGSWTCADNRSG